jgi:hypothetical protein
VGGFDERFPRAYREDADLGLRVTCAGWHIVVGTRSVEHPVRPAGWRQSIRSQRGNADDIDQAVQAARQCYDSVWSKLSAAERGRLLMKLSAKVAEHADELTAIEQRDCGKPTKQARADDHERAPDMKQAKVEDNILELTVNGEVQGRTLDVVIARFIREAETNVTSGENKNDTLKNHNIVQSLFPLGAYAGGKQSYRYPLARLHAQESCALFLQDQVNKRIVAAQKCLE